MAKAIRMHHYTFMYENTICWKEQVQLRNKEFMRTKIILLFLEIQTVKTHLGNVKTHIGKMLKWVISHEA